MWQVCTNKSVRVIQAFNALKYLTALSVVFLSAAQVWHPEQKDAWFVAWIGALVGKTAFCYYWDVVMDWGLIKYGSVGNVSHSTATAGSTTTAGSTVGDDAHPSHDGTLLLGAGNDYKGFTSRRRRPQIRARRLYPDSVYIAALIFNLFGRISWALAISPEFCRHSCRLLVGLLEIVRRGIWLVLRVEYATCNLEWQPQQQLPTPGGHNSSNASKGAAALPGSLLANDERTRLISNISSSISSNISSGSSNKTRRAHGRLRLNAVQIAPGHTHGDTKGVYSVLLVTLLMVTYIIFICIELASLAGVDTNSNSIAVVIAVWVMQCSRR